MAEGDPYEPIGLRLGTFDVFPAVEAYGGYDSNPGARNPASGSAFVTVAPELRAQSNWVRHELKADLRGSYNWYRDDLTPSISRPQATGSVDGRIDVTRDGDMIDITVEARSFLHHQVRSMVGSLKLVGDGKWPVGEMKAALDARDRTRCGPVAPPTGLYLMRVDY